MSISWTEKKGFTLRVDGGDEYVQITCDSLEQAVEEVTEAVWYD